MSKRIISVMLLLIMVLTAIACADTGAPADTGETDASSETLSERESIPDDLPEIKFGNETFTVLVRSDAMPLFYAEEETADPVDDALYRRDSRIEERFEVKIDYLDQPGSWVDQANFVTFIRTSVSAADNAFDLIDGYAAYITTLVNDNLLYNISSVEHINPEKPWWSSQCVDELTINGNMYFLAGDYSLYMWNCIFALVYNKQLAEDYSVGDLYGMVNDGEWTLDALGEIVRGIYTDDGNSQPDMADTFGIGIPRSNNIDAIQVMFGCDITVKDEDGLPRLNLDDERFTDITSGLFEFLYENTGVFAPAETYTVGEELLTMFKENRLLIQTTSLGSIELLRGMDVDFGILPYPKYNAEQENYISVAGDPFTLFCIPNSIQDTERCGILTEALCAESYKSVIPAYYELALKDKLSRDDESKPMLDLIRDCLTFNFGAINSVGLSNPGPAQVLRVCMNTRNTNFVSQWNTIKAGAERQLGILISAYE